MALLFTDSGDPEANDYLTNYVEFDPEDPESVESARKKRDKVEHSAESDDCTLPDGRSEAAKKRDEELKKSQHRRRSIPKTVRVDFPPK
ncbi:MAG: hypothetical protein E4H02_11235 [Lentisphaerales bacterium]|jgi:hypothetical protein|nr:MAG: hypothetical protein E4H02_11235 [Lentisphaerales bacterium]